MLTQNAELWKYMHASMQLQRVTGGCDCDVTRAGGSSVAQVAEPAVSSEQSPLCSPQAGMQQQHLPAHMHGCAHVQVWAQVCARVPGLNLAVHPDPLTGVYK